MENKFTNSTIESIGWYVYLLKDPRNGETFYVGKGCGNRVTAHVTESIKSPVSTDKLDRIREITAAGYDVVHVIHRHGMTEEAAFEVEAALIDLFPALTNAVAGNGACRGPKTVKQINEMYDAKVAEFGDLKVLMIKINNTFGKINIMDATCFSWKISGKRLMDADVVLGVANGIIRSVIKPVGWEQSDEEKYPEMWKYHVKDEKDRLDQPNRKVIIGTPADDHLQKQFMGKAIPANYSMKGSQQALRYTY